MAMTGSSKQIYQHGDALEPECTTQADGFHIHCLYYPHGYRVVLK